MIILMTNKRSYLQDIRVDIYSKGANIPDGIDLLNRGGSTALAALAGFNY